ncbi:MAG: hypothetical protein JKY92_03685 [Magnetovibrio sp.]|nr:hypothetical protein [Magnetovibrio sp.]
MPNLFKKPAKSKLIKKGKISRIPLKQPGIRSVRVRNVRADMNKYGGALETRTALNPKQIESVLVSVADIIGDITSVASNISIEAATGLGFSQCNVNICNGEDNGDCSGGFTGPTGCDAESSCDTNACDTHTCTGSHTCGTHDCSSNACSNLNGFIGFSTSVWESQAWADIVSNIAKTKPTLDDLRTNLSIQITPNFRLG